MNYKCSICGEPNDYSLGDYTCPDCEALPKTENGEVYISKDGGPWAKAEYAVTDLVATDQADSKDASNPPKEGTTHETK